MPKFKPDKNSCSEKGKWTQSTTINQGTVCKWQSAERVNTSFILWSVTNYTPVQASWSWVIGQHKMNTLLMCTTLLAVSWFCLLAFLNFFLNTLHLFVCFFLCFAFEKERKRMNLCGKGGLDKYLNLYL